MIFSHLLYIIALLSIRVAIDVFFAILHGVEYGIGVFVLYQVHIGSAVIDVSHIYILGNTVD